MLLAAAFATGATAIAYEVIWTRLLASLCLGSSIYAFASMLTVFLLGIVIGSAIYAAALARAKARTALAVFAALMAALGVMGLIGPRAIVWAGGTEVVQWAWRGLGENAPRSDTTVIAGLLGASALVLLAPTTILGVTFPLLARLYSDREGEEGGNLGRFYAANTLGAIAGSFLGTFALLGMLGACAGLQVLAAASVIAGAGVWVWLGGRGDEGRPLRLAAAVPILCATVFAGMGLAPRDLFVRRDGGIVKSEGQTGLVFDCEDSDAWVAVWRSNDLGEPPYLKLFVNGRALSDTSFYARRYMKLMSHLPILLHGKCEDSLVICFGTGMTYGATTVHPLRSSECVELSRAVLRAADRFAAFNLDVARQAGLDAGRGEVWRGESRAGSDLTLRLEDGRTRLLASGRTYDLITLEPPHPRDAGSVNLYSSEFYRLCKRRLKPGGMVMQWIPLFQQSQEEIRREVRTFVAEFPHATGWMPSVINLLLLGSDRAPEIDVERIRAAMAAGGLREDLDGMGFRSAEQLLGTFFATREALDEYAGDAPPLTDDVPAVEYYRRFGMDSLTAGRGPGTLRMCSLFDGFPEPKRGSPGFAAAMELRFRAMSIYRDGTAKNDAGDRVGARLLFQRALRLVPDDPYLRYENDATDLHVAMYRRKYDGMAADFAQIGDEDERRAAGRQVAELAARIAGVHYLRGEHREAAEWIRTAIEKDPGRRELWARYARRLASAGAATPEAAEAREKAIAATLAALNGADGATALAEARAVQAAWPDWPDWGEFVRWLEKFADELRAK